MKPVRRWQVVIQLCESIAARNIAEVGVQKGYNAGKILKGCELDRFLLVDVRRNEEFMLYLKENHLIPPAEYREETSLEAAAKETDGSLDLCYLDARHFPANVLEDCEAWYPKVRRGGILAGHDYGIRKWPGVKQVVDQLYSERVRLHAVKNCSIWSVTIQ